MRKRSIQRVLSLNVGFLVILMTAAMVFFSQRILAAHFR